jgi:regulator of sirC expression with transglutaminase-like and TPR domain
MSLHDYLLQDPACRNLAEGALLVVAPLLEDPDPAPVLERLEGWELELAARMPLPWSFHGAIDTLNDFLFTEVGLQGDRETYDDPDNALLPRVMARKRGLPIALSILWIDLARRLGFDAVGVALPGHFITGVRTDLGILHFDPFHGGRAVGEEDAARLVRRTTQGRIPFDPSMLAPVAHRAILARLVRNLHARFLQAERWEEALWTSTHLILLTPEDPQPYRDRAFLRLHRNEVIQALEDLREAIRLGEDDPQVAAWVERLERG